MRISDLPENLQPFLNGRDIIVFDGECVLCSSFMRFIHRHDNEGRFHFVIAQGALGQSIYTAINLPVTDFETNLVITDGRIWTKLDAFAAAISNLGWPWRAISALHLVPRVIGDPLYSLIARNRYRIWGRYDTCMIPDATLRARFIELE